MVARIKSGKSIRGILTYNENKVEQGQAKVLLASGFATDIDRLKFQQKLYRFEQLTQLNARSKTNAMHISLNFHADDKLDAGKLQQIASVYMEKIGLSEQPFIAYQHFDASHPHIHIATVLIDRDGKRVNTNNIGRERSEPARKMLEEKFGLVKAQGRRLKNEPYLRVAEYGTKPTKRQLNNITKAVMRDYTYTSFAEYKAVLIQFNVHVERGAGDSLMFEKKGLLYSIMDGSGISVGVPFKASAFHDGATMKNLEKRFGKNKERRRDKQEFLVRGIERAFGRFEGITRATFQKELAAEQVVVVFRQNENGLVYGLTFIDHRNRTVFNGSDLGKGYSAKGILERLALRDEPKRFLANAQNHDLDKGLGPGDGCSKASESLLDGLLARADFDPLGEVARKRKKKNKGQSHSRNV